MPSWSTSLSKSQLRRVYRVVRNYDDIVANQAWLAHRIALLERPSIDPPPAASNLASRVARQADCGAEYDRWLQELDWSTVIERKAWEFVAISRALEAAGCLAPGKRGLGFGVGREPLVAAYANRGCDIVATDLPPTDPRTRSWEASGQHGLAGLDRARVTTVAVDMNDVPEDLVGFDFCWSACALEHLGSLEAGLAFIERSLRCLRPGGWAVHTTEFNLQSNGSTIESGDTVLYRQRDLDKLSHRLAQSGHTLQPLMPIELTGVLDRFTDIQPFQYASLIIRLFGYQVTSVVLIIQAGA